MSVHNVVVIGSGHVGLTLLSDLEATKHLHGAESRLLYFGDRAGPISDIAPKSLELSDIKNKTSEFVDLRPHNYGVFGERASRDILTEADIIFVTIPDIPQLRIWLLDTLARFVPLDGKILVFVRAGQGGQPVIAHWISTTPQLRHSSIVLVEDSFYGTRIVGGSRIEFKRKLSVNASVYSLRPAASVLATVQSLFPRKSPDHALYSWPLLQLKSGTALQFDPLGYIIHAGVTLHPPNIERTKSGIVYRHYTEGIDRGLAERLSRLDDERVSLADAYGVDTETFPRILHRQYGLPIAGDFYAMMQSTSHIYKSVSPKSVNELRNSRHLLEDVPGMLTIQWLARRAGLPMPETSQYADDVLDAVREIDVDEQLLSRYVSTLDSFPGGVEDVRLLLDAPHKLSDLEIPSSDLAEWKSPPRAGSSAISAA